MNAISLVFVGGQLDKQLSNVDLLPNTINFHYEKDYVSLHIGKNQTISSPIHVKYLNGCAALQCHVTVDDNSAVSFIEEYAANHEDYYLTQTMLKLQLNKNANVNYYKIQNENQKATHENTIHVAQDAASTMNMFFADCGSNKSLSNINIQLCERSAACAMQGLYFLNHDAQDIDNRVYVDHLAEHGTSSMVFKGVLDKRSKAQFTGKVHVHEHANKSNAHQENHNLLLSPHAEVGSKPQLEIYADDIKCTHGATVGQLDQNALFYLRARGIDQATALKMLTDAFVAEVMEKIEDPFIRTYIQQRVAQHETL